MARTLARWTATVEIDGIDHNHHSVTIPLDLDQQPGRQVTATVAEYQIDRFIRHLTSARRSLRNQRNNVYA